MKDRSTGIYMWPELIEHIQSKGDLHIIRTIHVNDVNESRVYSKLGREGDRVHVLESGKIDGDIYIRRDGTAYKRGTGEVIWDDYKDSKGAKVKADKMPEWAARYRFKIHKISLPTRVQAIPKSVINNMGFKTVSTGIAMGDTIYETVDIMVAFKLWWNEKHNIWTRNQGQAYSYPFDDESRKRWNDGTIPANWVVNPYVTIFNLVK